MIAINNILKFIICVLIHFLHSPPQSHIHFNSQYSPSSWIHKEEFCDLDESRLVLSKNKA